MRKDLNMKHKTTLVVTLALLGAWALAASGEAPGRTTITHTGAGEARPAGNAGPNAPTSWRR